MWNIYAGLGYTRSQNQGGLTSMSGRSAHTYYVQETQPNYELDA